MRHSKNQAPAFTTIADTRVAIITLHSMGVTMALGSRYNREAACRAEIVITDRPIMTLFRSAFATNTALFSDTVLMRVTITRLESMTTRTHSKSVTAAIKRYLWASTHEEK